MALLQTNPTAKAEVLSLTVAPCWFSTPRSDRRPPLGAKKVQKIQDPTELTHSAGSEERFGCWSRRGSAGVSRNTSKWVCDANQASFCFAFAGFNMTFSPQNGKRSHCKNISTDLLIAASMMHLMCPCYLRRRKPCLSCYIWTRHEKLGADVLHEGSNSSAPPGLLRGGGI